MRALLLTLTLAGAGIAHAQPAPALREQVAAALAMAPVGTRFGLLVVDERGNEIIAIAPDQRFIPASNTKLFTTAAAMEILGRNPAEAERLGATSLGLAPRKHGAPDMILRGGGGISLSSAADCAKRCLSTLVAAIAGKTRKVQDIIADDTAFVAEGWSPGMSWNNIQTDSGTATSALIVDDNQVPLEVTPGAVGQPPNVSISPYFTVRNEAMTVANGETRLAFARAVNSLELRVYGTIAANAAPWHEDLGIDDPADYAGWALRRALAAQKIAVRGTVRVRHRPAEFAETPAATPAEAPGFTIIVPAVPLDEEVATINKRSQNLHAEALLRRTGLAFAAQQPDLANPAQGGSIKAGLAAQRAALEQAGLPAAGYGLSDGSGISSYNRLSPRAVVGLLSWAKGRPWAASWRASLPIGGVDGTLRRRFAGTPLMGRIWAKTGTLNATNALSGYLLGASGRELTFSVFANDVPGEATAVPAIDAALQVIAAGS